MRSSFQPAAEIRRGIEEKYEKRKTESQKKDKINKFI